MTLTVYSYIILEVLLTIIDNLQKNSILIEDLYSTLGPLLCSLITIYNIFYTKFHTIYERNQIEDSIIRKIETRKSYNIQRNFDVFSKF